MVEEQDTIVPLVRALNGRGDSVAATVYWAALDTVVLRVLDSTTGATLGKRPGGGQLQARVGSLRSSPLALTVRPQADTIFVPPPGTVRDTVTASTSLDSLSDSLKVQLQDLTTTPGTPTNLAGRLVVFQITYPSGGAGFTLVPQDSVLSGTGGIAAVRVKLITRTLPDSVVVTATAVRANGQPVPGSGITFVVEYSP